MLTKGVFLIDNDFNCIQNKKSTKQILKSESELINEIKIIKLTIPKDLNDNHSIANLWGMFRLCEVSGIDITEIKGLEQEEEKLSHIYFKWLKSINKKDMIRNDSFIKKEETIRAEHAKLSGLKVIGKIDLT